LEFAGVFKVRLALAGEIAKISEGLTETSDSREDVKDIRILLDKVRDSLN